VRIVIDLQACQTPSSRHRGIGRYSMALALAMTRLGADKHDIWVALNGCFPEAIDDIRRRFHDLLPPNRIVVFQMPRRPTGYRDSWRDHAAEVIREHFLADLKPDIVHVSSLFEGADTEATTTTGAFPTAVTLYDLIPLLRKDVYLTSEHVRTWYYSKIKRLKDAQLWLAISEWTREKAIAVLDLPKDQVVNISSGTDDCFTRLAITDTREREIRNRYGLNRPFLMYCGGTDSRKNAKCLVEAFSLLPTHRNYQLAIVCSATEQERRALLTHAAAAGLGPEDVVMTGFVPDEDLVVLYNLCHLFVFPSLDEGFGLPALEAMACGAPVIGSNTSSIPEVLGRWDALFDPTRPSSIANAVTAVLDDEGFRRELRDHGLRRARLFSWDESATRALAAFEQCNARTRERTSNANRPSRKSGNGKEDAYMSHPNRRPRLAFVLPQPLGVAVYSAGLLVALARHYDITLVAPPSSVDLSPLAQNFPAMDVTCFEDTAETFERILYQFNDSASHQIFGLLDRHCGVVVLDDFFLGGTIYRSDTKRAEPGLFRRSLYRAHGYAALLRYETEGADSVVRAFPTNWSVIDGAMGVIVHSRHSLDAARAWYGSGVTDDWRVIPQPWEMRPSLVGGPLRVRLGLDANAFLVCSFGGVDGTGCHHRLLEAFLESELENDQNCHLVLIGEIVARAYGDALRHRIAASPARDRIHLVGHPDASTYQAYLAAADAVVQLSDRTCEKTLKGALDALDHGLALIINASDSIAELPDECLIKLPESFDNALLIDALHKLRRDIVFRRGLGAAGRRYVAVQHDPGRVALQYRDAIEVFVTTSRNARYRHLVDHLAKDPLTDKADAEDLTSVAVAVAANFPVRGERKVLIDITGVDLTVAGDTMKQLLSEHQTNERIEPIYWDGRTYRYAVASTCRFLDIDDDGLTDEVVDVADGDSVLVPCGDAPLQADVRAILRSFESKGADLRFCNGPAWSVMLSERSVTRGSESVSNA
jgi:glycosyltransferase involved in cell wall biosynthesis